MVILKFIFEWCEIMKKGFKKVLGVGFSTLILGSVAMNLHIIPPNYILKFAEDKPYDQIYDVESYESCNDFFTFSKDSFGDYIDNNQMYFSSNVVNVDIDSNLSIRNRNAIKKGVEFYNKLFKVINPNISFKPTTNQQGDADIKILNGGVCADKKAVMTTIQPHYTYAPDENGNVLKCMPNEKAERKIVVWDKAKESSDSFIEKAVLHEFLHIFGINDHNSNSEHNGKEPITIMNYKDIKAFSLISPNELKITPADYFALVELYGPFANHENSGIQNTITETEFYHNEHEYNEYINSKMSDFCYSQKELDMISQVKQNNFSNYSIVDVIENEATKD